MAKSFKSLKSLRFQKYDKYDNPIFIASASKPEEEDNFEILKNIHDKLEKKEYGCFLPVYNSDTYGYSSIRFKKNVNLKVMPQAKYDIDYSIYMKTDNNRTYINACLHKVKLVSRAPKEDKGEELEL